MEENIQLAKLLLEGKTCRSCIFYNWEQGNIEICFIDSVSNTSPYNGVKELPKEMICYKYKGYE